MRDFFFLPGDCRRGERSDRAGHAGRGAVVNGVGLKAAHYAG